MNSFTKLLISLILFATTLHANETGGQTGDKVLTTSTNPFTINFAPKKDLTNEDYINIQNQTKQIDIASLVKKLFEATPPGSTPYEDFLRRCANGVRLVLIDPENKLFPTTKLEKIGEGGDRCVICYASYNHMFMYKNNTFAKSLEAIPEALKTAGFNGYFFSRVGGFPNPTGEEIQYVGTPYCYKVFLILEAKKLGFTKILAIDSSFLPLRDPTPLFDWLNDHDVIFIGNSPSPWGLHRYIFPETHKQLKDLTGVDVLTADPFIWAGLLGMNLNSEKVGKFIADYYEMVKLGTPFLSAFPEQFVYTALMNKPAYQWKLSSIPNIYIDTDHVDAPERLEQAKKAGYFFYNRKH